MNAIQCNELEETEMNMGMSLNHIMSYSNVLYFRTVHMNPTNSKPLSDIDDVVPIIMAPAPLD